MKRRLTLGGRFARLEAGDVRAFMAARRSDAIAGRSLMRALAGLLPPRSGRLDVPAARRRGGVSLVLQTPDLDRTLPLTVGEAVAMDVHPETSTLRVTLSRDAFAAGDFVAMRK